MRLEDKKDFLDPLDVLFAGMKSEYSNLFSS